MAKSLARWLAALVLLAWTLLPALACAADFRQMTEPEMACCKKMAGKCDMGTGQHSCCEQTAHSQEVTRATLTQIFQLQDSLQAFASVAPAVTQVATGSHVLLPRIEGSPPESPPGSITILRI
jgi:hypothetical protein